MTHSPLHIAVVGAGLAGLSCAQALTQAGHAVTLFEKSRGASGRMSTRRGDSERGAWQCDHGAQYFTARDPAFRAEVARWQAGGAAAPWHARLTSFDGTAWSAPTSQVDRFVGTPRMTSPAAWLVQELSGKAELQLQTTVQKIERIDSRWTLTSAEHGQLEPQFDSLVLAIPSPQVVPLAQTASPEASALAAGIGMRGSWSVMLRFDAPADLPCDGAFINAGPLRWMARDNSKPGRPGVETWLLHATPEWSEAHIEDDADSVTTALLAAFAALGGPAPTACSAHRWRYADTDPASAPAGDEPGSWWSDDLCLGLCGDWLHGGKVQGAWLSGQHVAKRLLG